MTKKKMRSLLQRPLCYNYVMSVISQMSDCRLKEVLSLRQHELYRRYRLGCTFGSWIITSETTQRSLILQILEGLHDDDRYDNFIKQITDKY